MSYLLLFLFALPVVVALTILVDWAIADLYFTRKWWSERPR
jgi:hypothetical protein